jgi:hypothetical protein
MLAFSARETNIFPAMNLDKNLGSAFASSKAKRNPAPNVGEKGEGGEVVAVGRVGLGAGVGKGRGGGDDVYVEEEEEEEEEAIGDRTGARREGRTDEYEAMSQEGKRSRTRDRAKRNEEVELD